MKAIVCLDECFCMAFNGRRQSMDKLVREKIASLTDGMPLYMLPYSSRQFTGEIKDIFLCDDLSNLPQDAFVFFETTQPAVDEIDELYAFMWNRRYPSDLKLGFDIGKSGFNLCSSEDFQGNSHDKITLNIYKKR